MLIDKLVQLPLDFMDETQRIDTGKIRIGRFQELIER
jgi:hypothetical protein